MKGREIIVAGDDAFSVQVESTLAAHQLATILLESGHWQEVVPGMNSVGVIFDPFVLDHQEARSILERLIVCSVQGRRHEGRTLEIPIVYGGEHGPDLLQVCEALEMSQKDFIAYHSSKLFQVQMIGFAPGFAYVGGLDARFDIPRLKTPRQFVPAGSIGITARFTGIYSVNGPGGWPIIGRTAQVLFEPELHDPFLINVGDNIQFTAIEAHE